MSKKTKIIKVTLCGPGDVVKEMKIAREVIDEWNIRNWESTGWAVKYQHWDSDSVPTMAERGQAAIDHQLIDTSNIVVAVFWTRLGTPTGLAGSGTEEEVTRAFHREIPVLAYFSDLEAPGRLHDKDQEDRLAVFRARMMNTGLARSFSSKAQFRKLFETHLDATVRNILTAKTTERKPRKPRTTEKKISQKAKGVGNVQSTGDNNLFNIKVPRDKSGKSSRELPGTIGADADMRTYATYLVGKYIDARQKGEKRVKQYKTSFHPGSAHNILGQGFGVTNSILQISQTSFFPWVASAQEKIRRTVFAKNLGHEFFHSWEEHLRQRGQDI